MWKSGSHLACTSFVSLATVLGYYRCFVWQGYCIRSTVCHSGCQCCKDHRMQRSCDWKILLSSLSNWLTVMYKRISGWSLLMELARVSLSARLVFELIAVFDVAIKKRRFWRKLKYWKHNIEWLYWYEELVQPTMRKWVLNLDFESHDAS